VGLLERICPVKELAHAISGLTLFKSWQEKEMAKKETKKATKSKAEKGRPLKPRDATAADEQTSGAGEAKTVTKKPAQSVQADVALISEEKSQEKIEALRDQTTINNDKGEEVAFDGEAKEVFIGAFEEGYPVIERALSSIYELGSFLFDVRKRLKPHKLYYAWLEYAGIPERTASNYVQVYERYAESLPKFGHLGIKKLLTAARLKNCVEYVEKNERAIAEQSADELDKAVKALRSTKKTTGTGKGRRPTWIPVGKCRIRPSMDGTKLVIEGITKKKQVELIEAIKGLLL